MRGTFQNVRTAHRSAFDEKGYAGPFPLAGLDTVRAISRRTSELLRNPRNRHVEFPEILTAFNDPALLEQIRRHTDGSFALWRTNFFAKGVGARGKAEIGWHHDKHFQDADSDLDFDEIGAHLSVLVALEDMTLDNGAFEVLPGSHRPLDGLKRTAAPSHVRSMSDHFVSLPAQLETRRVQITLNAGEFLLCHSALLHRSLPYGSGNPRVSMVGRLVRDDIRLPAPTAAENCCVQLAL